MSNDDYQIKPTFNRGCKTQETSAIQSCTNASSKLANIQKFWQMTVKNYYEEELCEIDRKDVHDP